MDNQAYKHPYGQNVPPPGYAPQYPQQMHQSSSNVTVVTAGGFQPAPVIVTPPERDWTVPAVMVTLCCFFPTGICAIIAAVNARSQFLAGDTAGARSSNAWARGLTFASIGFGVAWIGVVIALYIWVWSVATSLNGY